MENYRNHGTLFTENLDEFIDSREEVNSVVEEYKACERADYVDYGKVQSLENVVQ